MKVSVVMDYSVVEHRGHVGFVWRIPGAILLIIPGEGMGCGDYLEEEDEVHLLMAPPALATEWIRRRNDLD